MTKEFEEYIDFLKSIQRNILKYIDEEDNVEENYQNLITLFDDQKILGKGSSIILLIEPKRSSTTCKKPSKFFLRKWF